MNQCKCLTRCASSAASSRLMNENAIDHLVDSELLIRRYPQAVVCPTVSNDIEGRRKGGGVCCEGNWVVGAQMHRGFFPMSELYVPHECVYEDFDVVYLGMLHDCWGHCITDNIKHLWPFVTGEIKKYLSQGVKLIYVTLQHDTKIPSNFVELLKMIGVDWEQLVRVQRPTRFRNVYVPDESFYYDVDRRMRCYTKEFLQTIDCVVGRCGADSVAIDRRIYLSRSRWRVRNSFAERDVERAFCAAGYEIVYPETLGLAEMVHLMRSCRTVAATEGSCAHNSLFMREGAALVILRKADYLNGYQVVLNQMRSLQVTYVDANRSTMLSRSDMPWAGPFFVFVSHELADLLGVRMRFPHWEYGKYLAYGLLIRLTWAFGVHEIAVRCAQFLQKKRCWR